MGRVKLTSSGDFELSDSTVQESTDAEVETETETSEQTLFSFSDEKIQIMDLEVDKDDAILGLLLLNLVLQAGNFYE